MHYSAKQMAVKISVAAGYGSRRGRCFREEGGRRCCGILVARKGRFAIKPSMLSHGFAGRWGSVALVPRMDRSDFGV